MPLYQKSVLNKYLKQQDKAAVSKAYNKFTKYFHDSNIQANIRASKEEEYQGIFLTELFVNILGYTMKPNANYNLVAEFKNEKNSKKADGAILKNDNAIGVIELKGTNTKDLEHIRQQAFDYKANQTGCVYVITSNFEKIRFYINNAVDFEEFDLFTLSLERFELLNLCLSFENIHGNIPLKIKEDSLQEEEKITKKFYSDYSLFKRELFRDLVKLNLKNEVFRNELNKEDADRANKNIKQALFQKSQKLIDRFLFIFFAEDRELLPPNSTKQILNKWKSDVDFGDNRPIYDLFKLYFNYLDTGRKGTDSRAEIFAYNGGLFKSDTILDSLLISNELLFKHCDILQSYDFDSQVDVNILGHIFENSLNEIESVNTEIEGGEFDKQTTKRKKDGVFYTPKYITKYIVDNTVGKLCEEKKVALKINDLDLTNNYRIKGDRIYEKPESFPTEKGVVNVLTKKKTNLSVEGEKIISQIEAYRGWLLKITICDPACGSGAFLNQALNFLIAEHGFIDELQTAVQGKAMVFPNIENTVLENNIFGVDINEESVEIAKLSLWLRTAQPRRKLNDLSSNIKCGNSLIDDKKVAGDKAFNWEDEFPHVFEKGGFDVIIGNPPYVNIANISSKDERSYLQKNFKTVKNKSDLYSIFVEKGKDLLKKNDGRLSYIIPNSWLGTDSFSRFREMLIDETRVTELIKLPSGVFKDAIVTTLIITLIKEIVKDNDISLKEYTSEEFTDISHKLSYDSIKRINSKTFSFERNIRLNAAETLGKVAEFSLGIKSSDDKRFISSEGFKEDSYPILRGRNISKYYYDKPTEYIWYRPDLMHDKKGAGPRNKEIFEGDKILIQDISKDITASFCSENIMANDTINLIYGIKMGLGFKYLLALLNSKLINFWFSRTYSEGLHIKINQLKNIPVIIIDDLNKQFIDELVTKMLNQTKDYHNNTNKFKVYLKSEFKLENLPMKLQKFYILSFGEFIKEVNKAIKKTGGVQLTKIQEMEWMEVFETKKAEAQALKTQIEQTDKEIDQMVYKLYELTDEEIAIVEGA